MTHVQCHWLFWAFCKGCVSIVLVATLQVFKVLGREGINVKMMSQGASKNNISLIVSDSEGENAVQSLHKEFFD